MAEMFDLQNQSNVPKHVYEEGTGVRYTLPASTVMPFPTKLAKQFIAEHPKYVRIFEPIAVPDIPGEAKMWIANNSGNPHLPKTVLLESMQIGRDPVEIPNPLIVPTTLTFVMRQAQIVERNQSEGDRVFHQLPLTIEIPPYWRAPYPQSIALWLLQRDGLAPEIRRGRLIRCREQGAFEPNMTWTLDDMRLYASMLDDQFFSAERMSKDFPAEAHYRGDQAKALEAKHELWRHLFFRIIDDQYTRPTREGFARRVEEIKTEQARRK